MVHYAAFIFGDAHGSEVHGPSGRARGRRRIGRGAPPAVACGRRRSSEGPSLRVPDGRNGLRSRAGQRSLLEHDQRSDLRSAAHLRLPRAPREARPDGGRGDARGRRERQGLHVPDPQRHLFHAGPGVQGREARARRAGLRLLVHAVRRPEEPLAVRASSSKARSRAWTISPSRRRRPASSTTTPRCAGWRRSTATRCASG